MQLWMSAEVDASVYEAYRLARPVLEDAYNVRFANLDYGAGVREWAFIPIIIATPELDARYPEVKRHDRRRGIVEFRLRVEYRAFLAAGPDDQVRLLVGALKRSLQLLSGMGIAGLNTEQMIRDFDDLAVEQGWANAVAAEPADAGDAGPARAHPPAAGA